MSCWGWKIFHREFHCLEFKSRKGPHTVGQNDTFVKIQLHSVTVFVNKIPSKEFFAHKNCDFIKNSMEKL